MDIDIKSFDEDNPNAGMIHSIRVVEHKDIEEVQDDLLREAAGDLSGKTRASESPMNDSPKSLIK